MLALVNRKDLGILLGNDNVPSLPAPDFVFENEPHWEYETLRAAHPALPDVSHIRFLPVFMGCGVRKKEPVEPIKLVTSLEDWLKSPDFQSYLDKNPHLTGMGIIDRYMPS